VLVVCQLPMSDARALVPGSTRLPVPDRSSPRSGAFVRGFGPLDPNGGADATPAIEAQAHQAIKLPNLERAPLAPDRVGAACAFRRLIFDGISLARVEVGLQVGSRQRAASPAAALADRLDAVAPLRAGELDLLIASLLDLPVRIRSLDSPEQPSTLHLAGPLLARLFERATTARAGGTPLLVRALAATLVIEYVPSELGELPGDARVIDATSTGGVPLAFLRRKHGDRMIGVWLLGAGGHASDAGRALRLALLQVHAEHEALRSVLARVLDGTITCVRGTDETDRLERYFHRVTTLMLESTPRPTPTKAIAHVLHASGEPVTAEQRALVVHRLREGRPQIVAKVDRYLETAEQVRVNASAGTPVRVFVSYSHKDDDYVKIGSKKSILEFLSGLQKENFVFWHDEELYASEQWDERIREEAGRADIALVLVSQFFLNSNYISNTELPALLTARQTAGMALLPLLLSASDWESYPWLAATQHLPTKGTLRKEYKARDKREELYLVVLKTLRRLGASKRTPAAAPPAGV
jgi:hypothetical protein